MPKFQFRLRALLALVTAVAIALAIAGWLHRRCEDQWHALEEIRSAAVPLKVPSDMAWEIGPFEQPRVNAISVPWQPWSARVGSMGARYVEVTELEAKGDAPVWVAAQQLHRFPSIKKVDLHGNSASDDLLAGLAGLHQLENLRVVSQSMDGSFLHALRPNTKLVSLSLSSLALRDEALVRICQFESLKELHLSGIVVKEESTMRELSKLHALKSIYLSGWFPDGGLEALAKLEHLEDVDIPCETISNAGIRRLTSSPSICNLTIWGATEVNDEIIDDLAAMPALNTLTLMYTGVTPAGVERLKRLRPDIEVQFVPSR
jgi:hypothetical protein